MANFNRNQYRDSRGRFAKRPEGFLKRAFHTFRGFSERHTFKPGQEQGADHKAQQGAAELAELEQKQGGELAELRTNCGRTAPADTPEQGKRTAPRRFDPEKARRRYIATIRADIKHLADWIEPEETGAFPRTIIKHIRRTLSLYEAVLDAADPAGKKTRPEVWEAILDRPRVKISGTAPEMIAFLELLGKIE